VPSGSGEKALDYDPGLARAWARQHQARPLAVLDSSPLRLVQRHAKAAGRPVPGVTRRLRWEIEHPPMIPDDSYICLWRPPSSRNAC